MSTEERIGRDLKAHMEKTIDRFLAETSEDTPVDELLKSFTSELEEATDKYVSMTMTKTKERPPWITVEVGKLL